MVSYEVFFPPRELYKNSEPVTLPEELKGVSFELFWECDEEVSMFTHPTKAPVSRVN